MRNVPTWIKPPARKILRFAEYLRSRGQLALNPLRKNRLRSASGIRVHVGCGGDRLPGFTQVDCRPLRSVDVVADLNEPSCFSPGSVDCFYSHAFFEHLFRDSRVPHLKALRSALSPSGFVCYLGLPYFPEIARQYLAKGPGAIGPVFDLFEVYRQTHGHPESLPSHWQVQVHKSLFDEEELRGLLKEAGFSHSLIFQYAYGQEPVAVSCGFYASPRKVSEDECRSFLADTAASKVNLATVRFL